MARYAYRLLMAAIAPLAFLVLLARAVRNKSYRHGLLERFGWGPAQGGAPCIWLHAVSLGEVTAAAALIRALRARYREVPFVLTTATPTGHARARELFGSELHVRFLPYDTRGAVRRFLRRMRPRIAIILETELWPTLLDECRRRAVPVVFASARLTPRSAARYARVAALFRAPLATSAVVAAQTAEDAERFIALGADRARTHVIGNVKFDTEPGDSSRARGRELRLKSFGERPVWIAGSTHGGEEELLVDAHASLCAALPEALLLLVPRHPQRFDAVANLLARRGIAFDRRSAGGAVRAAAQVLLVDSIGELAALYAAADAAFVGGSLVPVGGHNLLEPAALGVPVVTGPFNDNGREIARSLIAFGGAVEVADAPALAERLRGYLADPELRHRAGARAREFVELQRGALARLLALIEPLLADPGPADPAPADPGPAAPAPAANPSTGRSSG